MACKLVALGANGECSSSDGGVYTTALTDCNDVADVIFDTDGNVTNFVMTSLGKWFIYEMDDDDTAFYNQEGERSNKKHTANQSAFMKFAGITAQGVEFANGIKDCCCLYGIHYLNSGIALVQGIDYNNGVWKKSKKRLDATVSILSDTGENEDRIEVTLNSTGKCFSQPTTLTIADLQAL